MVVEPKKIYELLNLKELKIPGISVDANEFLWLKAIDNESMPWERVRDTKRLVIL